MVGPPSSWSRDQGESLGRLGQRSIRFVGVRRSHGRPFPVNPISHFQQLDRWDLASRTTRSRTTRRRDRSAVHLGGEMLFKAAIVLLAIWLLGVVGAYRVGDLVHVFLLVGLTLVLLAMLKARDAALRPPSPPTEG